jgi:hypothetical protein
MEGMFCVCVCGEGICVLNGGHVLCVEKVHVC